MPVRAVLLAVLVLLAVPAPAGAAGGWPWPVKGPVLTAYRNGDDPYAGGQHRGIDIAAPVGTAVVAAAGGTVHFAGTAGDSGLTVSVRTADGRYDTSYLHLSALGVRAGAPVAAGDRIGSVGLTGKRSAVAPHLHFGIRDAGQRHGYHDPLDFLSPFSPPAEAPRGVPVPLVVPRPLPVPEPVRAPGRVRRPAAPRVRVPAGRRVRVPAGRPVRVPAGRRFAPPVPRGAPVPRLVPAPRLVRGARRSVPGRAPERGPITDALPVPEPHTVPVRRPGRQGSAGRSGPDLGWALACLGLLAAAACLGRPGSGGDRAGAGTGRRPAMRIPAGLRALLGGR